MKKIFTVLVFLVFVVPVFGQRDKNVPVLPSVVSPRSTPVYPAVNAPRGGYERSATSSLAPAAITGNVLSNKDVTAMVGAGMSDELILRNVQNSPNSFDLSVAKQIELKSGGVSDGIIAAMLDATSTAQLKAASPASSLLDFLRSNREWKVRIAGVESNDNPQGQAGYSPAYRQVGLGRGMGRFYGGGSILGIGIYNYPKYASTSPSVTLPEVISDELRNSVLGLGVPVTATDVPARFEVRAKVTVLKEESVTSGFDSGILESIAAGALEAITDDYRVRQYLYYARYGAYSGYGYGGVIQTQKEVRRIQLALDLYVVDLWSGTDVAHAGGIGREELVELRYVDVLGGSKLTLGYDAVKSLAEELVSDAFREPDSRLNTLRKANVAVGKRQHELEEEADLLRRTQEVDKAEKKGKVKKQ